MTFIINPSRFAIPDTGIAVLGIVSGSNTSTLDLSGLGLQENDYVLVFSACDTGNLTLNTASGYSYINRVNGWTYASFITSRKFMGATPDSSITGLTSRSDCGHIAIAIRGVNTTTPEDVTGQFAYATSGSPNPPSVTSVTDGCMIITPCYLGDDLVESSYTPSSGYTADAHEFGSTENGGTVFMQYKKQDSAGAENPGSLTTSSDEWAAWSWAIRPAA